jgi:D-3-phosphoglycerate dehydrogenase
MPGKVLFTVSPVYRGAVEWCMARLEQQGLDVFWLGKPDEQLSGDELVHLLDSVEIYVVGNARIPRRVIEAAPGLRLICKYGVGVDNIDLQAATERGVLVTNAPGANAISVAEMTLGLILCLARRLKEAENTVRQGGWRVTVGRELYARTLGIVGLGNIGKQVAVRAKAFGMKVLSNDIVDYPDFRREHGVEPVGLDELLAASDVVTLHVPLTPLTRRMISGPQLARMKRGALLIDTARGGVIVEEELAHAVASGHLAGAALDVFEQEPLGPSPLRDLPQVILTPHVAGITREAADRVAQVTLANVLAFLAGQAPPNLLNPEVAAARPSGPV